MMTDILTVMWKEWREFASLLGSLVSILARLFILLVILYLFLPSSIDNAWSRIWCTFPIVSIISILPYSVTGERERHSLATLLASCLPDYAIALGKMSIAVLYGWIWSWLISLTLLVKINFTNGSEKFWFYPLEFFGFGLVTSLLLTILVANGVMFVSLRAATIKQASTQSILVILIAAFPGAILGSFVSQGHILVTVALLLLLALVDLMATLFVIKHFQRSQLLLY